MEKDRDLNSKGIIYIKKIPWYSVSLLLNICLKPHNIFVITPAPARAAQLEALSLHVTATFLNPVVIMDAVSTSKPLKRSYL